MLPAAACVVHSISLSQTVPLCAGHQGADLLPREDRRRRARNLGSHWCVLSRPTQVACRCPVFLKFSGWRGLIPSSIDPCRYPHLGCCPVSCATEPSIPGCGWLTAGASRTGKDTKNPIPRDQTMKALQVCPGPVWRQARMTVSVCARQTFLLYSSLTKRMSPRGSRNRTLCSSTRHLCS